MTVHFVIEVPLVNPNEPEAMVVDLAVTDGDQVSEGDVLCSLETSKSVEEVFAEASGYVLGLSSKLGHSVTAGEVLCYIAGDPDWTLPETTESDEEREVLPEDLQITEPALAVARELNVDLQSLPIGVLVTERLVRESADTGSQPGANVARSVDARSVVVYGMGGHGKTLIELIRAVGSLEPIGVIDDSGAKGSNVLGVPVIGSRQHLDRIRNDGVALAVNAIGGITNMGTRLEVTRLLSLAGFMMPVLVHPSAVVEQSARIGSGAQILAHSYVGSDAEIGEGVIVNTSAVVSHDCLLGDHVNLAPGCLLAGSIRVGPRTLLGMGVTTYLGIEIGADVRAGNGAILTADVPDGRRIHAGSSWVGEPGSNA